MVTVFNTGLPNFKVTRSRTPRKLHLGYLRAPRIKHRMGLPSHQLLSCNASVMQWHLPAVPCCISYPPPLCMGTLSLGSLSPTVLISCFNLPPATGAGHKGGRGRRSLATAASTVLMGAAPGHEVGNKLTPLRPQAPHEPLIGQPRCIP